MTRHTGRVQAPPRQAQPKRGWPALTVDGVYHVHLSCGGSKTTVVHGYYLHIIRYKISVAFENKILHLIIILKKINNNNNNNNKIVIIIMVIIIIMNCNSRGSSHSHHGPKRRELAQHAHWRGSHAFAHALTSTSTLCEAPAQLLQNLESNFYFEGTWGRGSKPECPKKLKEKIQRPGRELNPHPPTLMISWPGQERSPRLTHWATDRRVTAGARVRN